MEHVRFVGLDIYRGERSLREASPEKHTPGGSDARGRFTPATGAASKSARGALGGAPETPRGAEDSSILWDQRQNRRVISRVAIDVVVAVAI